MGVLDFTYRLKPESGDAAPNDETGVGSNLSGGTITLVDDGANGYCWQFVGQATGTTAAAVKNLGSAGTGITIAFRAAIPSFGGTNTVILGWVDSATAQNTGIAFQHLASPGVRARYGAGGALVGLPNPGAAVLTYVMRLSVQYSGTNHRIDAWVQGSLSGTAPTHFTTDFGSTATITIDELTAGIAGATLRVYDLVCWPEQLSDADCAALVSNGIRATLDAGGGDTTAPTLTSPTGTGGTLTCSGSVSTNEANGTLYAVVTASSTAPSAAQVKAGQDHTGAAALRVVSQAVSATGTQTIGSGSATAGTRYWHFMHEDAAANQSAVVSSASFVVSAAGPTINTQPGNQTVTAPAAATFTVAATASAGSLTYQWQRQPAGGGGYSNVSGGSGATSASYTTGATTVSGGGHNNGDTYRCIVTDSNGSTTSSAATLAVNAALAGLTSSPLKDNTGTLHLNAPFEAFVLNAITGALVVRKTGQTSHASTGVVTFTDAALSAATQYRVVWRRTDTGAQGVELLTAA